MTRRLFTLSSVLSLLLWVFAVVVWLDSYGHWDAVSFGRFNRDAVSYSAMSFNHQFRLARVCNDWGVWGQRELGWEGAAYPPSWRATADPTRWDWGGTRLGFTAGLVTYKPVRPRDFRGSAMIVGMPPWLGCVAAAVLPLWWLARRRPRRMPTGVARGVGATCAQATIDARKAGPATGGEVATHPTTR
ncbi:MAG TPA: hypothetical protein VGI81_27550 [Tepidisphaeraceae bacterium]